VRGFSKHAELSDGTDGTALIAAADAMLLDGKRARADLPAPAW
jgi:hypothetical protein